MSIIAESAVLALEAYRHSRCVVMFRMPGGLADTMRSVTTAVSEEDLYEDPTREGKFGREDEPHVTVLYGIKDPAELSKVREVASRHDPFVITFGKVSAFTGDTPYDVLKVEVKGEDLHKLHRDLRKDTDNDYKWPDYKPHATIAYLKKGASKRYVDAPEDEQPLNGVSAAVQSLIFRDMDGYSHQVDLKHPGDDLLFFLSRSGFGSMPAQA